MSCRTQRVLSCSSHEAGASRQFLIELFRIARFGTEQNPARRATYHLYLTKLPKYV